MFDWGITTGTVYMDNARFTGPVNPTTSLSSDLVFADFENGRAQFVDKGFIGTYSNGGTYNPVLTDVTTPVQEGSRALRIDYNNPPSGGWSVVFLTGLSVDSLNATAYGALNFWARGSAGGEKHRN